MTTLEGMDVGVGFLELVGSISHRKDGMLIDFVTMVT